jgi:uncharacterized protein YjdB
MWKSGWISNVRRVVAPVAIALLSACGGGDDTTAPPPPTGADALSAVHVTPATASVTVGASTRLSASGLDAHGRAVAGVSIAWVALDPSVAPVEADGTVTGVQAGEARVVASASGFADTAVVAVSAEPGSEPGPTLAASVQVSPGALSLQPGGGYQLAALVFDASSQPLTTRTLAWRSLEPAAATVSAAGYVNAVAEGTARLVAEVDGASDTVTVIVARAMAPTPVPASVAVTPATLTLAAGGTRQLTATVRDAGGQALTGYSVVWSVGDGSVATVSSTGLVTAVDGGTTTITAVAAGRSASATLTVTPAPVASVVVTPGSGVLVAGGTLQLTATPYSAAEKPLSGRSVSWTSSNSGVVRVSSTGLVTAVAAGTATVSATVEGRIGMASIQVSATAPTPVATVTIAPTSVSLEPGHAQQFTATARDAGGQTLTGRAVTWSGGSATVATVSASGLVTAVGVGSTTVTATVEGRTAQATVIVTAPPPVRETRSLAATTRGTMARDSTGAELPLPGVLVAGDDEAGGLAPLQAVVVFSLADIPAGATIESATLPVTMDPAGIFGDPYALGALHVERSTDVSMNLGAVSAGAIQLAAAPTASVTADLRALLQAAVDAGEPYLILRIRFEQAGNGNDATDQLELAVGELGIAWLK